MPTVLPMTRVEAYLAFKAGVISESDLKPSLKTNFYSGLENWLAYWCGLTADYPKDENNDPKWYTEEEYYVAYLCGIAPDYPVNCYRRVGAYLRYIISARWDKPEKPLTREEYYLSLMSTTYLPANDPASVISIDNTAEAPFGDLKIYGDTFQQPNPSPDYPQDINVATGAQTVKVYGKNIIDWAKVSGKTDRGITGTVNQDGSIHISGTASSNGNASILKLMNHYGQPIPAGTYAFSWTANNVAPSNLYLHVNYSGGTMNWTNGGYHTLPSESVSYDIRVPVVNGTYYDFTLKPQLEKGTKVTAYEPYQGQTYGVNLGKNLFDKDNSNDIMGYINASIIFKTNNTTGNIYIPCLPNTTYTIQKTNSGDNPRFCVFTTENVVANDEPVLNYVGSREGNDTATSYTITTPANAHYLGVFYRGGNTSLSAEEIKATIQIELGSTPTSYASYFTPIELCKIGSYQDYIYKSSGKWYKHAEIGKVIVNTTNASLFEPTGGGMHDDYFDLRMTKASIGMIQNWLSGIALCEYFSPRSGVDTPGVFYVAVSSNNMAFYLPTSVNDLQGAKDFMDALNGYMYFVLATPTDTEITDSTLIAQLNALLEGGSYDYQTNIVVSAADPNLPGLLQVTAAKWQ